MNKSLAKQFLTSVSFLAVGFQTQAAVRSKAIVGEFLSDLPEQAQDRVTCPVCGSQAVLVLRVEEAWSAGRFHISREYILRSVVYT
jgi:hypothetical protein